MPNLICEKKNCGFIRKGTVSDALEYISNNNHNVYCPKCKSLMWVDPKKRKKWEKKASEYSSEGNSIDATITYED